MKLDNIYFEYQYITNKKLIQAVHENESLQKYFKQDFKGLKTSKYCGTITVDDEDFYILPKVSEDVDKDLDVFTYMLMNVFNIKLHNASLSNSDTQQYNIMEYLIQHFAKTLFEELQRGIYKEYVTEQDNLKTMRGKYLAIKDMRTNFVRNRIYCEYDEFSPDNTLNQFFLYAIETLLQFTHDKKNLKNLDN